MWRLQNAANANVVLGVNKKNIYIGILKGVRLYVLFSDNSQQKCQHLGPKQIALNVPHTATVRATCYLRGSAILGSCHREKSSAMTEQTKVDNALAKNSQ